MKHLKDIQKKVKERFITLSPKEQEVCKCIGKGMGSKEIGKKLNKSVRTISSQRKTIRKKLGITNRSVNLESTLKEHFKSEVHNEDSQDIKNLRTFMYEHVGKRFTKDSRERGSNLLKKITSDKEIILAAMAFDQTNPNSIFNMSGMLKNIRHNAEIGYPSPGDVVFICESLRIKQ